MVEQSRQDAFDRAFGEQIERLTPSLVDALRGIVTAPLPADVKILVFEAQADWRGFPVHAFAMDDESPNEVYFEPPFYGDVLPDADALIPPGTIDQDAFEDAGVDTVESGSRVMAPWFGECWHEAGGADFPRPAYFHLHDRSVYFDLKARRWVRDEEIWPQ